ncbi:hypothetical protein CgunFtcFv8_016132 [Champsocephalus gunnari]|uniref:Uncharacterized protein n=1 Tax=Champsocephalus gunnari TaxID=52237 RepID=A0AAN8CT66_CHAGU|nr:hypothetical protein CgunFtcFv8_016132 [Champsocephalus gunnari]
MGPNEGETKESLSAHVTGYSGEELPESSPMTEQWNSLRDRFSGDADDEKNNEEEHQSEGQLLLCWMSSAFIRLHTPQADVTCKRTLGLHWFGLVPSRSRHP